MAKFTGKNPDWGRQKRESFPYRKKYLEHNPGILGGIYICSQCLRPMSRDQMEVDHIFPNSHRLAPNKTFNCVAICPVCNKRKSNKIGFCTVKGVVAKGFEEMYLLVHNIVILIIKVVLDIIRALFGTVLSTSKANSGKQNIVMYLVIAIVIFFVFGGVFN